MQTIVCRVILLFSYSSFASAVGLNSTALLASELFLMLNNQTYTKCRKCQSTKLEYFKVAGYGKKLGMVYHYKARCLACGFVSFVKRTADIFLITEKQDWVKSKSLKGLQKDGAQNAPLFCSPNKVTA